MAAPIVASRICPAYAIVLGLLVVSAGFLIDRRVRPPERAGAASSLPETSGELGAALGVAALGSIGTAVYRGGMEVPADIPREAAEAVGDSLAGAIAAAKNIPAELGTELTAAAHWKIYNRNS
ncbi:hypothetical protein PAE9249_01144 [Paenibacillus sp. CECT 9249]|nr:hypothetical protein PAE9249_01144 [Paenibacillus sp. CECT 9249]